MKTAYHFPGWTLLKSLNFKKATKFVNSTEVKTHRLFFSLVLDPKDLSVHMLYSDVDAPHVPD